MTTIVETVMISLVMMVMIITMLMVAMMDDGKDLPQKLQM